jgi:succinate-acetate transporter protein
MASTMREQRIASTREHNGAAPAPAAKPIEWGNSAPLALAAFAVTTFMLSMINAGFVSGEVQPVVFGVALMFGGLTQLLAGLIQLRTGNTFAGVLFSGFGAFWLSLFAIAQFFLSAIPADQHGHALGLFLYAFGFFVISMTLASFRTNAIVVAALLLLIGAFFGLAAGEYGAHTGLIHVGGYLGLGAAALALYLSCAETCEETYGRSVLPVWSLKR